MSFAHLVIRGYLIHGDPHELGIFDDGNEVGRRYRPTSTPHSS